MHLKKKLKIQSQTLHLCKKMQNLSRDTVSLISDNDVQVEGFIDLAARIRNENFLPYLTGIVGHRR